MLRTVRFFGLLIFAVLGCESTPGQDVGGADSRPPPFQVAGRLIFPEGVGRDSVWLSLSEGTPESIADPASFSYLVHRGTTWLHVSLMHWFWSDNKQSSLVDQRIEVRPDGTTEPPGPFVIDIRPLVRTVRVEVTDARGRPLGKATVGPLAPVRRRSGQWNDDTRATMSLDKFGVNTGDDGKAVVLVPVAAETPQLVVYKAGYRSEPIDRVELVNKIALKDGVQIRLELPSWLVLPDRKGDFFGRPSYVRDATIDLEPSSDVNWWAGQSASLYDAVVLDGGPRAVIFCADPGDYTIGCSLIPNTFAKGKARGQVRADGSDRVWWRWRIPVTPSTLRISDTDQSLEVKVDLDRAAYDRSEFAKPGSSTTSRPDQR